MARYQTPDVYINDVKPTIPATVLSSSIGVMIGRTRSGVVNEPVKVTSWSDFLLKFANGLDTPFSTNNALGYLVSAVYGFFANGGTELYVINVANTTGAGETLAKKATHTGDNTFPFTFTAKYYGSWLNGTTITVKATGNEVGDNKEYELKVAIKDGETVTVKGYPTDGGQSLPVLCDKLMNSKASNWFSDFTLSGGILNSENTYTFTIPTTGTGAGADGTLTDNHYINALKLIDNIEEASLVAIPGYNGTNMAVAQKLVEYCTENGLFPIVDSIMANYDASVLQSVVRTNFGEAFTGAFAVPWGYIKDPVNVGSTLLVPPSGHTMGVYARIIESRGVHKAPAGVEATVNGFVALEAEYNYDEIGMLNTANIIPLVVKTNVGIVVWGARSINTTDSTMRYVSDGLLNLHIKRNLYNLTQFAVFEPNGPSLWGQVSTVCEGFLENLRLNGAFKGSSAEESYYVKVDASNNPDSTINEGELHIQIGYAPNKPAEFVIIDLAHTLES